jgi:hypothetical protein
LAKQFQRRRFFLEINQLETIITCGGHVCKQIGKKLAIVIEGLQLGTKHSWKVIYKDCPFRPDPLTNKATIGNACF